MKYRIYHQLIFCLSSAKSNLTDVWLPHTEMLIPVVFKQGFLNVPDYNDLSGTFPQKAF